MTLLKGIYIEKTFSSDGRFLFLRILSNEVATILFYGTQSIYHKHRYNCQVSNCVLVFISIFKCIANTFFPQIAHIYAFKNGGGRNTRRSHLQLQLWELNYIHIRISLREFSLCRRQSDFVKTLKSFYGPNLLQFFRFFNSTSVHAISQFAGQATYAVFLFAFFIRNY